MNNSLAQARKVNQDSSKELEIPSQLKGMRFNRVRFKDKKAFEKNWQNKPYSYEEIQKYFPAENYGVLCGTELRVLDDDTKDKRLIKLFIENFGETFRVRDHLYLKFDNGHYKKIIFNSPKEHLGEIQGEGTYVVGAGSTHPSGEIYEQKNDLPIKTISYNKFAEVFGDFINGSTETREILETKYNSEDDDFIKSIKAKWNEGDRQELAMSLAGYLRKNKRLGLNSALSIIERIARDCNDNEINQRLSAVQATYEKDEDEVKGISGLDEKGIDLRNSKIQKVDFQLENISRLVDPLEIENELQKIKKETGYSIKILRDKVAQKKKEFAKNKPETSSLKCEIDPRFNEEELLIHISKELDKDHIDDDREKLGTFLAGVSSKLPNPKDHVSVAHKGDSSSGKTNIQLSVVKHFPSESCGIATRITQSEMEDRIVGWDILVVTEINKNREGANTEIVETFKAIMEDGIRIFKKDNLTGEPKEINVPQKTGFYATTETEGDDELETRYIIIPVRGSENKNRAVVDDVLSKVSDANSILNKLNECESWIAESIRGLNSNLDVVIPFAQEINKKLETEEGEKELFDYSKERVKRDVKRLMSLTKAIAWLFQKRRDVINDKIIVAQPTDFLTALKIFLPFFNVSYSGLDPRISELLEIIKKMEGKHSQEIENEFGLTFDKKGWVIRAELQKKFGVSINTMKNHIQKLKDEGLIETYWEQAHPKFYLIRPVNIPISRLLDPVTLHALTGHLTGHSQVVDRYKKLINGEKPNFDTIPLVKNIEFEAEPPKLTGVKLTGQKSKEIQTEIIQHCSRCNAPMIENKCIGGCE